MPSLEIQMIESSFDFGNAPAFIFSDFPGFTTDIKEVFYISRKKYRFLRNVYLMNEFFKAMH